MSDELCIHEIDPRWCSICLHGPKRTQPWSKVPYGRTIDAQFATRCEKCGDDIEPGDAIHAETNGEHTRWVCC